LGKAFITIHSGKKKDRIRFGGEQKDLDWGKGRNYG